MYPVDLHTHTTRSDGRDTPAELLRNAARRGIQILALTDHDIRPPESVDDGSGPQDAVEYARALSVRLIRGIEISCDTENEDVHIVALGCDWADPWFEELERRTVQSKLDGYRKVIDAFTRSGMPLSLPEILQNSGIAQHPELLQKKHIFEMIAKKGYTKTWNDAKILVQQNPKLNFKREKPRPEDTISAIHHTGGTAILAHPFLIDDPVFREGRPFSRHTYLLHLMECGLDGIEGRYTYDKTSYKGSLSNRQIYERVRSDYLLPILSGGSDYHADAKSGAARCRELGEAGLTEEEFYANPLLAALLV